MASECPICILPIEKAVECSACQYKACVECVQGYITTSEKPECIRCHVPFTHSFMHSVFPSKFVNEYIDKPRIEDLYNEQRRLIDIEMPLVPLFQTLVRLQAIRKFEVSRLIVEVEDAIKSQREELHRDVSSTTKYKCSGCKSGTYTIENPRCQLCEKLNCVSCETVVNGDLETHQCTKSDLDTLAEIKKESKRCPKCSIWISKIDGCNDMFCTECRTPFNYRTGEIIKRGGFHNPHYIDHLNRGGQRIFNDMGILGILDQDEIRYITPLNLEPIDFQNGYVLKTGERERIETLRKKIIKIQRDTDYITSRLLNFPRMLVNSRNLVLSNRKNLSWLRREIEYDYRRNIYHKELRTFNIHSMFKVVNMLNDITDKKIPPTEGLLDIAAYIDTRVKPEYALMDGILMFPKLSRWK
jgi:hypothetical protein